MFDAGVNLAPEAFRDLDPDQVQILDVREPWEFALVRLPGARLIPLGELADRAGELDPSRPVAAYCHHGVRSRYALAILRDLGFAQVAHLSGGIDAFSRLDPSVTRY
ncbi:rhodanese-like domain-containing protein [Geothrix rubra]|uniref:Rhodanese-like domain-containing protein n=1 Tax=Geothrix rubra TaxID=2927977 RepID=A0ABQ5Q2F4_9BACT|nr:rhodanese-like domain-containing protein [Geothrix rubra]GLH68935.1 rhodanese-like domain-containing protein [Geothrix rubra]